MNNPCVFSPRAMQTLYTLLFVTVFSFASQGQVQRGTTTDPWNLELTAFPNPTNGITKIESRNGFKGLNYILVTDLNGNFVEIDLSSQPTGTYLVHLLFEDRDEEVRIVKQ